MGIRQQAYWLKQAYAVRRQRIEMIAYGVSIGMADKTDKQKALDGLELTELAVDSARKDSEATWNMLYFLGSGKHV